MAKDFIRVGGAREHNLKNLTLEIPRDRLVVVTGLSGSGKSSLAFDTIYAEGQRKYVESLSAYARQFLDQMQKPEVDFIEGLSPAVAIEQRSSGASPRSIIATTTEIYDYLRLLYAHVGQPHCPDTAVPIVNQYLRFGSSPRGAQTLLLAAKVRALTHGRFNVSFEDLEAVAVPALRHRLILNFEAEAEGITTDHIIAQVLKEVPKDAAVVKA